MYLPVAAPSGRAIASGGTVNVKTSHRSGAWTMGRRASRAASATADQGSSPTKTTLRSPRSSCSRSSTVRPGTVVKPRPRSARPAIQAFIRWWMQRMTGRSGSSGWRSKKARARTMRAASSR